MKFKDPITGEYKTLHLKTGDTLPVGTIVSFEGDEIPEGYEEVIGEEARVVISPTEPTTGEEVWLQKGKNLLDINNYTILHGAIALDISRLVIGKTYTFSTNISVKSFKISSFSGGYNSVYKDDENGFTTFTFTMTRHPNISEDTKQYLYLATTVMWEWISDISQLNGYNIQIEQGETATDYEEFVFKKIYTKNDNGEYEEFNNAIVESGSNVNGNWIKYSDGRMECWQRYGLNISIDKTFTYFGGQGYYKGIESKYFPKEFKELDCLIMSIESSQKQFALSLLTTGTPASLTGTGTRLIASPSLDENDYVIISYHAKGRWK